MKGKVYLTEEEKEFIRKIAGKIFNINFVFKKEERDILKNLYKKGVIKGKRIYKIKEGENQASFLVGVSVPREVKDKFVRELVKVKNVTHCHEREHPVYNIWFVYRGDLKDIPVKMDEFRYVVLPTVKCFKADFSTLWVYEVF